MPRNHDGTAGPPPSAAPAAQTSAGQSSPAQELVKLLQEFTLEANRYANTAGGKQGMHRTDLNALAVIMRHSAADRVVTPGILRSELHLSSPATTALVDRLCASGHVVRERLGTDRRQVQLRMTPKAYKDGSAMFMPLAAAMGKAMAPYSAGELELVHRFMSDMLAATAAAGQDPAGPRTPPGQAG
ncbi:MarR family winged helix-turn-helix transcriptional regulator [Arthrobacter celericrescens]|uniref:MarR family winged helix-turn-helix transcriptional regulator n=1 Tax=Arthrobacter celericrescens TaxID=2320851 RepID=UPI000EA08877|nr:MarR family transcriptional regulator [Arthrobacter celericrescens]